MSRWSSDVVHATLYPRELVLARTTGWLRPRVTARARYEGAPLEALDAALREARWHGARLRVGVSHPLVRYAVMPAAPGITDLAGELALAEARFRQVHGPQAGLEVRLSDPLSGRAQLIAGLDLALLAGLRERCPAARLRLVAVQPRLALAFEAARLPAGAFWFASVEPGALLLAHHGAAGWDAVAVSARRGPLAEDLRARLREQRLLAPMGDTGAEEPVLVHGAGPDAPLPEMDGIRAQVVPWRRGVQDAAPGI